MHLLGFLALLLVVLGMLYTAKRVRPGFPGSLGFWMGMHRWGTTLATVFAFIHTDLVFEGMALVTLLLMTAITVSGVVGSYIHVRIPRTKAGKQREIDELERELAILETRAAAAGLRTTGPGRPGGTVTGFVPGMRALGSGWTAWAVQAETGGSPGWQLAIELRMKQAEILRWEQGTQLMKRWREVHVPLSFLFFAALAIHVLSIFYY
jgi:hypothetical protein